MTDARTDELAGRRAALEERLAAACAAAGRDRGELTVIAVTKTFPAEDVRRLAALGLTDVGENRDQEASVKAAQLTDLPLRWHFVGQLQTNKCRSVSSYADVVHSVDRARLVDALDRAAAEHGRRIGVFVQVDLDGQAGRGGAAPGEIGALAGRVAGSAALDLLGLMAVAPRGGDPRAAFDRLHGLAVELRSEHPRARAISAGMSGDLEAAIAAGATHLRIGTALLGGRPPVVR